MSCRCRPACNRVSRNTREHSPKGAKTNLKTSSSQVSATRSSRWKEARRLQCRAALSPSPVMRLLFERSRQTRQWTAVTDIAYSKLSEQGNYSEKPMRSSDYLLVHRTVTPPAQQRQYSTIFTVVKSIIILLHIGVNSRSKWGGGLTIQYMLIYNKNLY